MIYCGMDNGTSGSIGFVNGDKSWFIKTPVKSCLGYQKTKTKNINRIDVIELKKVFEDYPTDGLKIFIERPMVNPGRFDATISAVRALEATLIVLEDLGIAYEYIDSKTWQKKMLPEGIKGSAELKKASLQVGIRMFPGHAEMINKHKDADGLLIAEWARREKL